MSRQRRGTHFEDPASKEAEKVVLSFVVADPKDPCSPSWGAAYSLSDAAASLDLDRRVARLQQLGGSVAVSFGGLANQELAVTCTDPAKLKSAYRTVVDRYNVSSIDLDVEGEALSDAAALERRSAAIAALQQDRQRDGKSLSVWLTLPADPNGLTAAGSDAVPEDDRRGGRPRRGERHDHGLRREHAAGPVDVRERGVRRGSTHRQLTGLYRAAGSELGSGTVWRKVGLTPMIGQNDIAGEIFTLKDAQELSAYASAQRHRPAFHVVPEP